MTVPYLLRFCSFRALKLCSVSIPRVPLRLPWAMRLSGLQPVATLEELHFIKNVLLHLKKSELYKFES